MNENFNNFSSKVFFPNIVLIIFIKHKSNIKRLAHNEENKFELIKEKITAVRKNDTHYREDKTGR